MGIGTPGKTLANVCELRGAGSEVGSRLYGAHVGEEPRVEGKRPGHPCIVSIVYKAL